MLKWVDLQENGLSTCDIKGSLILDVIYAKSHKSTTFGRNKKII